MSSLPYHEDSIVVTLSHGGASKSLNCVVRDLFCDIAIDPKMRAVLRSYRPFFHTLVMELANKVMSFAPH